MVLKCIRDLNLFRNDKLGFFLYLIEDFGQIIKEMLKLKLYLPYCVIILAVLR
jgi:hypothetical protein